MNWPVTLSGGESLAVILTALVSIGTNVGQAVRARRSKLKPLRLDLELIPLHYVVTVNPGVVPTVFVTLRAINYTEKPIHLEQVRGRSLQLSGAQALEEITSSDPYEIPARQSREVYCRRPLVEAEAVQVRRAAVAGGPRNPGSIVLAGRGTSGRRRITYEPGASFAITGLIEGVGPDAKEPLTGA